MKILVINGPNLNLLGRRQPEIYGHETLDDIASRIGDKFPTEQFLWLQSNHEGDLIDYLHEAAYGAEPVDGIILNAGGFTHTSVALADAVAAIHVPVVEVHLSNVASREDFRHHSFLSPVVAGTIQGFGSQVYDLAVAALLQLKN